MVLGETPCLCRNHVASVHKLEIRMKNKSKQIFFALKKNKEKLVNEELDDFKNLRLRRRH